MPICAALQRMIENLRWWQGRLIWRPFMRPDILISWAGYNPVISGYGVWARSVPLQSGSAVWPCLQQAPHPHPSPALPCLRPPLHPPCRAFVRGMRPSDRCPPTAGAAPAARARHPRPVPASGACSTRPRAPVPVPPYRVPGPRGSSEHPSSRPSADRTVTM